MQRWVANTRKKKKNAFRKHNTSCRTPPRRHGLSLPGYTAPWTPEACLTWLAGWSNSAKSNWNTKRVCLFVCSFDEPCTSFHAFTSVEAWDARRALDIGRFHRRWRQRTRRLASQCKLSTFLRWASTPDTERSAAASKRCTPHGRSEHAETHAASWLVGWHFGLPRKHPTMAAGTVS